MTNRNNAIDICRGIGIILVVLGHGWMVPEDGELFRIIFSFHMPLFFFLAGVFINPKSGLGSFASAKAATLLKPYFATLIMLGLLKSSLAVLSHQSSNFDPVGYFEGVAYGTGNTLAWVPLWFLPHLFISSIVSVVIVQQMAERTSKPGWTAAAVALVLLVVGISCIDRFWNPEIPSDPNRIVVSGLPGLPWSADLVPVTSAFILFGYLLREHVKSFTFNAALLMVAVFMFGALHYFFKETINLNLRFYGNPIIATTQAFLGIYITLNIAALVSRSKYLSQPIEYIGMGSLFILIFHVFIQRNVFQLLSKSNSHIFMNSMLALACGVLLPLVVLELTKRSRLFATLLLPQKVKNFAPQSPRSAVER